MSLELKSKENIELVEHCINEKRFYSAVAGRIYYAIFQKMKYLLIKCRFDYDKFLQRINKPEERKYSHGTIKFAIGELLKSKGINTSFLNYLDNIYKLRRKADYEDAMIDKNKIMLNYKLAKEILNSLNI